MIKDFSKNKIYYLAHPCTNYGISIEHNRIEECKIASELQIKYDGIKLVRPLTIIPDDIDYEIAMDRCYKLLSACDGLLLSPGWEHSKGCKLEICYAMKNSINVLEIQ